MSVLLVSGLVWLGCSLALLAGVAYAGRRPWPDLDPDDCQRREWDAAVASLEDVIREKMKASAQTPIFDALTAETLAPDFALWEAEVLR